ncbi:MAG: hypothetical protein JKX94_02835 [Sneathiella sp.]|nr:hypothetical protein [Sneathiella sp.]
MTDAPTADNAHEPDVFSRGSLTLTYELIRKSDAELALAVRNICQGDSLPRNPKAENNKNSDYFRVGLDSFQVRAIVEGLMTLENADPGRAILAKALIEDWMQLAQKMIDELPNEEKPTIH